MNLFFLTLSCLARHNKKISDAVPKFWFYFKKGSSKKFPMSVATMSRRQKEPILGYVPKNDEKRIHAVKG